MTKKFKLGVIGFGNMAKSIVSGIISDNMINPNDIIVSAQTENTKKTALDLGLNFSFDNRYVVDNSSILIIAVKPQVFRSTVKEELQNNGNDVVVSIMAGIKANELFNVLGHNRIVRVMPNLPSTFAVGVSGIYFYNNVKEKDFILKIFNSIGSVVEIGEDLFDSLTCVSGSGPAYVFYFIKSMIDGGVKNGLSYEDAKKLTIDTIIGSTIMVEKSNIDLNTLINNVCSQGGTTIEAINCFNQNNMNDIIVEGMTRCKKRSEELSK